MATRRMMRSRFAVSFMGVWMLMGFLSGPGCTNGSSLDAFLAGCLEDALHVDAGSVDGVGIQFTGLDQVIDLRDGDASGGGDHGIEITRGSPVDQIALAIPLPCLHEGEVRVQGGLQNVFAALEGARLLAFGDE